MVELNDLGAYIWMIAWAALFGALGGLAAHIIAGRQAAAAAMKQGDPPPEQPLPRRMADLATGALGSVFLGAVAAVISLYLLAPVTTTVGGEGGGSVERYNIVQLVALALVVGAAGETVIAAAQARVIAAVQAEKAQTTATVAEAQVEAVGQRAMATMDRLAAGGTAEAATRSAVGALNGTATHAAAREELRQQVEAAKSAIRSIAR